MNTSPSLTFLLWVHQSKFKHCFLLRCVRKEPMYTWAHRFAHRFAHQVRLYPGTLPPHAHPHLSTFSVLAFWPSFCFPSPHSLWCLHFLHKISLFFFFLSHFSEAHFHFLILLNQLELVFGTRYVWNERIPPGNIIKIHEKPLSISHFAFPSGAKAWPVHPHRISRAAAVRCQPQPQPEGRGHVLSKHRALHKIRGWGSEESVWSRAMGWIYLSIIWQDADWPMRPRAVTWKLQAARTGRAFRSQLVQFSRWADGETEDWSREVTCLTSQQKSVADF